MGKDLTKQGINNNYAAFIKGFIIEVVVTAVFVSIFAVIMFLLETGYNYASLFATVSIAAGTLIGSMYTAGKIGNKGYVTGMIMGGFTFILVTLISLFIDSAGLTYNTLFHLIIIMLSALIGGVFGVNKSNNKKYI